MVEGEPNQDEEEEEVPPAKEEGKTEEDDDDDDDDDEGNSQSRRKANRRPKNNLEKSKAEAVSRPVDSAVSIVKSRESVDDFLKRSTEAVGSWVLDNDSRFRAIPFLIYKTITSIFEFTIKLLEKKGKLGFGGGYDIMNKVFSFEVNKKGKK